MDGLVSNSSGSFSLDWSQGALAKPDQALLDMVRAVQPTGTLPVRATRPFLCIPGCMKVCVQAKLLGRVHAVQPNCTATTASTQAHLALARLHEDVCPGSAPGHGARCAAPRHHANGA